MMKWIAVFVILFVMVSPVFAGVTNVVPNPSFEQARPSNASLPLDWYQCNDYDDYCPTDAFDWKIPPFTSDAFDGILAVNITDDANGQAVDAIGTDVIGYNISGGTNMTISFYWKVIGAGENYPIFWVADDQYLINYPTQWWADYWYFEYVVVDGVLTGTQCIVNNQTAVQLPFDCVNENVSGGWTRTTFNIVTPEPFNPHFSAQFADGDGNEDFLIVDNFTLTYITAEPASAAPITGATAGIIGFLPLLIGVGIIVMVARKIEDMKSTEDFIAVIVGTGLAIVFLGVFAAIIAGLI